MLLRLVAIENFRAVQSARITFEPTTVLIGENDCGRTSVMEAVALALGWRAREGEFGFQPYHIHRTAGDAQAAVPSISIALEFSETDAGEWDGQGFEPLRTALPEALNRDRRFRLEVTHSCAGLTGWAFRAGGKPPLVNHREMLAWLRRRMPVFRMSEGILGGVPAGAGPGASAAGGNRLADQVRRHYKELLEGTAPDVTAAIEGGASAARRLLLSEAKLLPRPVTSMGELLEEIEGRPKSRRSRSSEEPLASFGSAANKIGLLVLVGAMLRAGAVRAGQGTDLLTLLDNPEANLHPMTLASVWGVMDRIRGQKIIGTHSGELLARARLTWVRRLTRRDGLVKEWRVPEGALNADELRRYSYHVRNRRAIASFARCWLLVEGETEFWVMNELARVCGYDFAVEGVASVEFAQSGLGALIKVAQHLGIEWHLLADGDVAGQTYARSAREYDATGGAEDRITVLPELDLEHCFWRNGYEDVFRRAAYPGNAPQHRRVPAKATIRRAIERHSKPYLAVLLLDAVLDRGAGGVPPPLRRAIEVCVRLARRGPG